MHSLFLFNIHRTQPAECAIAGTDTEFTLVEETWSLKCLEGGGQPLRLSLQPLDSKRYSSSLQINRSNSSCSQKVAACCR